MPLPAIAAERLDLSPLAVEAIEALLAGDRARLAALTGAVFPTPLVPPPMMEDALPFIRDRLRDEPGEVAWWSWLLVRRDTGRAVGSVGFGGPPDDDGATVVGYAVYPEFQGQGVATEATRALVAWALAQPGARLVRAMIPPVNAPSRRVAEGAGLRRVGTSWDDGVGDVLVYEVAGDAASS